MDEIEEIIVGRMEFAEDGPPTFTPGLSMELNGAKTFIPGKVSKQERRLHKAQKKGLSIVTQMLHVL